MDDKNNNKQFRIYDESQKYIRLSVDETIARKYNNWKDWYCSAGIRGLYIDYDGNVWVCNTASSKFNRFNYDEWKTTYMKYIGHYGNDVPSEWQSTGEKWIKLNNEYLKTKNAFKKIIPVTSEGKKGNPGFIGNIYEIIDFTKTWFICPWESCSCGADVVLSKAKTKAHRGVLAVTNKGWAGKELTIDDLVENISEPIGVETHFPVPYQVLWDLSRKCNYDCSYCWPSVHNNTDEHKDYNLLLNTVDNIIQNWANHNTIRWNFGGGEPTLHPNYKDLMKYLKDSDQYTMVTSNGTRDYKYWTELSNYMNSILLSAHFDGLLTEKEEDRFVRNVEVICKNFELRDDDHWLEIKLMAPPQHFDRALRLREKILGLNLLNKIGANNRINGFMSLVPIRSLHNSGVVVNYTDNQLEFLRNQ